MLRLSVLVAGLAAGAFLTLPCSANIITNGSFETHGETTQASYSGTTLIGCKLVLGTGTGLRTSTTALPGWTVSRTGDDFAWFASKYYGQAGTLPDGNWAVDIEKGEPISQSFTANYGKIYTVSYSSKSSWMDSGSGQCWGQLASRIDVAAGTLNLLSYTQTAPVGSGSSTLTQTTALVGAWTVYTYVFTVSANTTATLTFNGVSNPGEAAYLDNVVVTAVPEPGSLALAAGLVVMVLGRRRS